MFESNIFDDWLDRQSQVIITAMGEGKPLKPEEMMVLVLKAQTNHFNHLDVELRQDMKDLLPCAQRQSTPSSPRSKSAKPYTTKQSSCLDVGCGARSARYLRAAKLKCLKTG